MPTYSFPLPTSQSVREDSRLRPEQVSATYLDNYELDREAQERIDAKATFVNGKIARAASPYPWPFADGVMGVAYPGYDEAQRAAETEQQKSMATQVVSLLAQASLYGSAGQLNPAYFRKATELKEEAMELLASLAESISFVVGQQPTASPSGGVAVWTIQTGDNLACDEYSTC